jgi:isopentenyl phosphate kinase
MKQELLIIKLGGSVITNKNSSKPSIRISVIQNLAKQISKLHQKGFKIIVIHGAGSYAHPLAKKYELHLGIKSEEQFLGFSKTAQSMADLNSAVIKSLIDLKVPAVSLPPHAFTNSKKGKLQTFNTTLIKKFLDNSFLPILFGDPILDFSQKSSILSGDTITVILSQRLSPSKIIFISDVDGIYDKDPKTIKDAQLIPFVNTKNLNQVLKGLSISNRHDVTGGIEGKIKSIKSNLPRRKVIIVNGLLKNRLLQAVSKDHVGTLLHFD